MRAPRALDVLPVVLLLLSGCTSGDGSLEPSDAGPSGPSGPSGAPAGPADFEPLVFEGTVTGGADCAGEDWLPPFDPVTPAVIDLPPEAAGHLYHLERTPSDTAPDIGATCLLFSDGTFRSAGETDVGRVPEGVVWVQVITNANVELGYRLTIG